MGRLRTLEGAVRVIGGRMHAAPTARTALPLLGAPHSLWPVSAECPPYPRRAGAVVVRPPKCAK